MGPRAVMNRAPRTHSSLAFGRPGRPGPGAVAVCRPAPAIHHRPLRLLRHQDDRPEVSAVATSRMPRRLLLESSVSRFAILIRTLAPSPGAPETTIQAWSPYTAAKRSLTFLRPSAKPGRTETLGPHASGVLSTGEGPSSSSPDHPTPSSSTAK